MKSPKQQKKQSKEGSPGIKTFFSRLQAVREKETFYHEKLRVKKLGKMTASRTTNTSQSGLVKELHQQSSFLKNLKAQMK